MDRVSTINMSRDDWLEARRSGIGGSDAATVVGLNPWASLYSLWADKTGRLPDKEDTEAMRIGRDLEDYVARRFEEATGKAVRRRNAILRDPDKPWAHANIDREVIGERAGLECKTTNVLNLKMYKGGEFPDNYYCQCMHYLGVTGWDRWYLAVLVVGSGFFVFTLERDEDEIAALMDAEKAFWNTYVLQDVAPEVDGTKPTSDAIGKVYATSEGGKTVEILTKRSDFEMLDALKQQKKGLQTQIDAIENGIKEEMGTAETGSSQAGYRVTWKPQTRTTFDHKRFAKDHPELDLNDYYKTSTSRVLRIKKEDN